MRTTVTLRDDVYEAARHLASVSGGRLGKVLSDLARGSLKSERPQSQRKSGRFPVFDVPPNAPVIPTSSACLQMKASSELLLLDSTVLISLAWPNHQTQVTEDLPQMARQDGARLLTFDRRLSALANAECEV
jgi:hypothetical protein